MFTGVDGQPIAGGQLVIVWLIIICIAAFAYYVWVFAPKAARREYEARCKKEEEDRRLEELRRGKLTPKELRAEEDALRAKKIRAEKEKETAAKKREEEQSKMFYGEIVPTLVCPHCQAKGSVRRTERTRVDKARVNSVLGKAAGIGTNTERKVLQMRCDNCETKWDV